MIVFEEIEKAVLSKEKVLYLRSGYCKHKVLDTFKIPFTDVMITSCVCCNKEMDRYYE